MMMPSMPSAVPAPPRPPADPTQAQGLQLSDDDYAAWKQRITASKRFIDQKREQWKANMRAYMAKVLDVPPTEHIVVVPIEYSYTELKKAQLAFQVPEVHLKPKLPGLEGAVAVFQAAVNHELGDDNADAKTLIDECLMDLLICGIAASKVAYVSHIRTRQKAVLQPGQLDPMTGQPGPEVEVIDPATGQPQMQDVPYLAGEDYRWDRFPAEQLLVPSDFEQSDFDRAPWLAMEFRMDLQTAKRTFTLPDNFDTTQSTPRETLSSDDQPAREHTTLKQVIGHEIWLQADVYDEQALPGQYRQLVLIDGLDHAAVYKDSPYQQIGDDGKLHGMEGNPICPLTVRFLPGSAYPISDVEIARPLSQELSKGRTQMIQFRDRVLPRYGYNRTNMDPETLVKLETGQTGQFIGFDHPPAECVAPLAPAQYQRENFTFNDVVRRDVQQTWATGATPGGQVEPEARTATEVNNAQGTADVRLDNERTWFLRWFCRGASKFGSLLQLFKDDEGFAEITGPDGVKQLQAWDRTHIQGKFAFAAKPDSALRLDADVERRQSLAIYNLLGKDPNVNRVELLKTVLLRHNIDPSKIVVPTPPPAPHPEPPKIALSFKGDDLGNPMVLAILQQVGIQLPTQEELAGMSGQQGPIGAPGQPQGPPGLVPHPGAMPQAEPLNKHALVRDQGRPVTM
jgi:hypothetical protein